MADLKPTGKNLFKNSGSLSVNMMGALGGFKFSTISDSSVPSGQVLVCELTEFSPSFSTTGPYFLGSNYIDKLSVGDVVTVTGYVKASKKIKANSIKCEFLDASSDGSEFTTTWQRFQITGAVKRVGSSRVAITFYAANSEWEIGDKIYLSSPKIELGTEATPWTPAPEDSLSGGGTNMILAFDVITLATVTDVQGIYRFYQLATSKPSKPTTYPPASAWSDEMPGYQLGNQDSLYFVDVTVFNDLTYQYGDVQLSTDYEAVKATYADALQQIANAEKQMQSEIQKTSESIRTEVSEDYYKKDQTDDLLGTISTALEQTKDSFTMQFNSFQADLENVNADNSAKFQELYQYIRFKGGSIELGETGNTITLTIENDRISFKQAGQEIAYMSNNQLYITDANIVTSLRIGNFIFSPRPNGSLDFKKVGA